MANELVRRAVLQHNLIKFRTLMELVWLHKTGIHEALRQV